ncbi:MAG: response regulator [Flaviaesturariibacter sp.]|nr:response regulator [Flaviaesturariibacter sp.]
MKIYNVIIVENDEDEQYFMREGFEASGKFRIRAMVANGDELLDWLGQHPTELPDFILSDLNMPGRNGYDIITDMRTTPAYSHMPVIITSTSSTKTFIDKCLAFGAADYVVKPETFIEYRSFVDQLHGLIEEKGIVGGR